MDRHTQLYFSEKYSLYLPWFCCNCHVALLRVTPLGDTLVDYATLCLPDLPTQGRRQKFMAGGGFKIQVSGDFLSFPSAPLP